MRTLFRILFPLVAIPTAIALLLGWALFTIVPQDKLRGYAGTEIGKRLNRQVVIGPARLRWNGITVDALRVSERPDFRAGVLFEAKGVRLGWNIRSLLQGLDVRKRQLTRSSGSFFVRELRNPHYLANNFEIEWSLSDIDARGSRLNGWAKLKQGTGAIKNLDGLLAQSNAAKVALAPVVVLSRLERMGLRNFGLPDLKYWPLEGADGHYTFENGLMTIRKFVISSARLSVETTGTAHLANEALALDVHLEAPKSGAIGALNATWKVGGTLSQPKVDLTSMTKEAFKASVNLDSLKKIFR